MTYEIGFFQNLLVPKSNVTLLESADIWIEDVNRLYSKTRELDAQSNCEAISNVWCRPLINVSMQQCTDTTFFFF